MLEDIAREKPFAGFLEIAAIEPLPFGKSRTAFKVRDVRGEMYKLRACKSLERAERAEAMVSLLPQVFPTFHGRDRCYLLTSFVEAQPAAGGHSATDAWFGPGLEELCYAMGKLHAVAHGAAWPGDQEEMDRFFADSLRLLMGEGLLAAQEGAESAALYSQLRREHDFEFCLDLRDSGPRNFVRTPVRLFYVDEEGIGQIKGLGLARMSLRSHQLVGSGTLLQGLMRNVRQGYESVRAAFPSREYLVLLSLYDLMKRIRERSQEGKYLERDLKDLRSLLRPAPIVAPASPSERPAPRAAGPRVCLATVEYPPTTGGVAVSAQRLTRFLAEAGFQVEVFTLDADAPVADEAVVSMEDGARIHRVSPKRGLTLRKLIGQADREARFDIFHGFFLPMAHPCLSVARQDDRPVIASVIASIRGDDAVSWIENPVRLQILKTVLAQATWITSVTSDLLARVAAHGSIADRSSLILNSVDGAAFPRWHPTTENRGVVGTLGKFREKKDIPLVLTAYAGLDPALRRKLVLAGFFNDRAEEEKVEASIRELSLAAEVELTGPLAREEIAGRLLSMRVFVQCSKHEGLPNALLEAAAAGVPLVTTEVGGARDILEDGENALLVSPEDPSALRSAIERVLRDEDLAQKLSQGALQVAARLQPAQEKAAWLSLYRRLLLNPPR